MPTIALKADGLSKTYRDGFKTLTVLRAASLCLYEHEIVAITGKSGCGKSTLLHLLGLLDRPDEGTIHFAGVAKDAAVLSDGERTRLRAKHVGFIFQHYPLLPDFNVLENVTAAVAVARGGGFCAANRKKASDYLEMTGLTERMKAAPKTLSGGERQRTAIARAFAAEARIILADEPTGSLDPETGAHIILLLKDMCREKGTATVIVTHEESVAGCADRSMKIEDGILT